MVSLFSLRTHCVHCLGFEADPRRTSSYDYNSSVTYDGDSAPNWLSRVILGYSGYRGLLQPGQLQCTAILLSADYISTLAL